MIREQIRQFIIDNFIFDDRANKLNDDDSFLEQGIIDSTGVLELVMFVEETFGIEVADEDVVPENLDSVRGVTEYVTGRLPAHVGLSA